MELIETTVRSDVIDIVDALPSALDGLRVVVGDDPLNNELTLSLSRRIQGEDAGRLQLAAFDRTGDGLAELQRLRPWLEATARYLNTGGSIWDLAALFTDEADSIATFASDIVPRDWQLVFTSQEVDVPMNGFAISNSSIGIFVIEDQLVQQMPVAELYEQFVFVDEVMTDGVAAETAFETDQEED